MMARTVAASLFRFAILQHTNFVPDLPLDLSDDSDGASDNTLVVDGWQLIVRSGTWLPPICVKTAQPVSEEEMIRKYLFWSPPLLLLLILASPPVFLVAHFAMRKRCTLHYALHRSVRNRYRLQMISKSLLAIALLFSIPFAVTTESAPIIVTVVLGFLASIVVLFVGNQPLTVKNHVDGRFWIAGCSPEFLEIVSGFSG